MTRRPDRWNAPDSDAPDGARALLAAARSPSPAQRARIWSAISASTATPPAPRPPHALPTSALATPASLGAKKLIVLLLGLTWHRTLDTGLTEHATVAPPPVLALAPLRPPAPQTPRPPRLPPVALPAPAAALAPLQAHRHAPVARVARSLLVGPLVTHETVTDAPAVPPAAPPAISAEQLAEESRILDPARDALRASPPSPQRAHELCRLHARRFPSGALSEERERIAIEALIALGRDDEALPRCDAFLREHAGSTVARGVREARAAIVARRSNP